MRPSAHFFAVGLLCPALALAQTTHEGRYAIDHWNTDAGLPQVSVNAILQSRDGYLWLATFGGIARFDGMTFTSITTGDRTGLTSDRDHVLAEDRAGRIWVGTDDGLARVENRGEHITVVHTGQGADAIVQAIAAHPDGSVWFGTQSGAVGRVDSTGVHIVLASGHQLGGPIQQIVIAPDSSVWIESGAGTWRLPYRSTVPEAKAMRQTGSRDPQVMAADTHDGVWETIHGAVVHWDSLGSHAYPIPSAPGLTSIGIRSIAVANGVIWLGHEGGQIWRFVRDSNRVQPISRLGQGAVTTLLFDREGSVWAGSRVSGLARLRASLFQVVTQQDGLANGNMTELFLDSRHRVWAGSRCFGAAVAPAPDRPFEPLPPSQRLNCVWSFGETPDGTIWMAGSGLARLRHGTFENLSGRDGVPTHDLRVIFPSADGRLWIGGQRYLAFWDGHRFTERRGPGGVRLDVRTVYETTNGTLWFGGEHGLWRSRNGGALESFSVARGLPSDNVRALYQDPSGALWAATYGGGLARIVNDRIQSLTTTDGLFEDYLSSVVEDAHGNLWFSGQRGVFRVARRELEDRLAGRIPRVHSVVYGREDGMISAEANGGFQHAVLHTPDGRLWYPTLNGIAIIDPTAAASAVPPTMNIERVLVNGRPVPLQGGAVGPGSVDLDVTYAGLSLNTPNGVIFRYRLDNWDANWVDAGTRRQAYYSRLAPGTYRFEVAGANRDGVWTSGSVAVSLVVKPYFWQTWWFRLLAAVALIGGGATVYRARVRAVRVAAEEAEREASQAQMTEMLQQKNAALAENLRLKDEVERIARHDLRTPLTSIISLAQIVREDEALDPQHETSLQLIEQAGYRVLSMANLTLDLFKMEQGTYELSPRPVDIIQVIDRTVLDLDPLLRTREVTCDVSPRTDNPARPWILGDELLAHSMLGNVVKNAVEASQPGRRVTVLVQRGDVVNIRIHNDGMIPPDVRPRFFEKYVTSGKKGGTGLGVYSARLMAETMGGAIRVDTSEVSGTTITIKLPASQPGARRASKAVDSRPLLETGDRLAPRSILLVDDDGNSRAILRHFLAHPAWTVDEAENAPLALRKVEDHHYDVIFMDVEMPVVDGIEAAAAIRAIEKQRGDPRLARVVALSSHDDPATQDRALRAGCDFYLSKPVTRPDIVGFVSRAAPLAHPGDGPSTEDLDLEHLMPAFLGAKRQEIANLQQALAHGDADAARRTCHRLRGSFSLYGFAEASALCAELEELSRAKRLGDVALLVPNLYGHLDRAASPQKEETV